MAIPIIPTAVPSSNIGPNTLQMSTPGSTCNTYVVQNNNAAGCYIEEDATATQGSFYVAGNGGIFSRSPALQQLPVGFLSVNTPGGGISINGTTSGGIVVRGYGN